MTDLFSYWETMQRGWVLGWTIYAQTTLDFPGHYVARAWMIVPRGEEHVLPWPWFPTEPGEPVVAFVGCVADTLAEARAVVGPEFTRLPRRPGDDLVIIETWL